MKNARRAAALLLCLLLLLGLTGCGSFMPRMAVGLQRMSRLQSLHTDTLLTTDLSLTLLGQESQLDLSVRIAGDHQKEPALSALDLELHLYDITQRLLLCTERAADSLTIYSSTDGGSTWSRRSRELEAGGEAPDIDSSELLKLALALADSFEEQGSVSYTDDRGETAAGIRYVGQIPAELVRELILGTGLLEQLPEEYRPDEAAVEQIGDLPTELVLDKKSCLPVVVELDLTQVLGPLAETALRTMLDQSLMGLGQAVALNIRGLRAHVELSQFDAVSVTLPSDFREA